MITKTNKLKFTTITRRDNAVNAKRPSKASRNFAKPVSYKDITEAMQKAIQSIEGTKRQYREVLQNEIIL